MLLRYNMMIQPETTPAHLTYMILAFFLTLYALFSILIRNRLHLSEPPLAMVTGIIFGPKGINALDPIGWGLLDDVTMELARLIAGLQVFAVGLELPKFYMSRHWKSLLWMLGPVMTFGWLVCALFICLLFNTDVKTALMIAACLTPTDPVLAASVLSNSQFSNRVPSRIRHLLSAESGCNDGVSFPFLYIGILLLIKRDTGPAVRDWFLLTILYQCALGIAVGTFLGFIANRLLRFSDARKLIDPSSFIVFYLLLAVLAIGVASTLGLDDFLVSFAAGATFAHDGWFAVRTRESKLNNVLDLLLNSTFFVFFGTYIPWDQFTPRIIITPEITPGKLVGLLILILLFRRIPALLAFKRFVPDVKTWREALFCGHFGPMGVGAIFLAIEARAQLENSSSIPDPLPDPGLDNIRAIELAWPIVTFVVFGSTLVHGLSVAAISIFVHFTRDGGERARVVGGETEPLHGMQHEDSEGEETQSENELENDGWNERTSRIALPP